MKKTWTTFLAFLLSFAFIISLSSPSTAYASTSKVNQKAHAVFEKKIKKIAKSCRDNAVYYKYVDITGNGVHDVVLNYQTDSGSASIYKILTINDSKTKSIFSTTEYGLEKITLYKKSKSIVYYSAGHGGESYTYCKMKKGKYKIIASKSRASLAGGGAENGEWNYYDAKFNTLSKSKFKSKVKGIQKGSKKNINLSKLKLFSL